MFQKNGEFNYNLFWTSIVAFLIVSLVISWFMDQNHFIEGTRCREKGGVYITTRYDNLCINSKSVIK